MGLGSNLGDPEENLGRAARELAAIPGVSLAAVSPLYRTNPQDMEDQPWFANQVAKLVCAREMTPLGLLEELQRIETALGRERSPVAVVRFGPRAIDLDLLLFDDLAMDTERLTLPHPRMFERAFVLVPLADIAPDLVLPGGQGLAEAIAKIDFRVHNTTIFQ